MTTFTLDCRMNQAIYNILYLLYLHVTSVLVTSYFYAVVWTEVILSFLISSKTVFISEGVFHSGEPGNAACLQVNKGDSAACITNVYTMVGRATSSSAAGVPHHKKHTSTNKAIHSSIPLSGWTNVSKRCLVTKASCNPAALHLITNQWIVKYMTYNTQVREYWENNMFLLMWVNLRTCMY